MAISFKELRDELLAHANALQDIAKYLRAGNDEAALARLEGTSNAMTRVVRKLSDRSIRSLDTDDQA